MGDVSDRIGRPTDNGQVCALLVLDQKLKALNLCGY
jgi:hypothetical protein